MKKIRILTGETPETAPENDVRSRGFSTALAQLKSSSLEIDAAAMTRDLQDVYTSVVESLVTLRDVQPGVQIDSVQFTLGFDTTGQVTLLSSVSGSSVSKTGITFNLSFKK